MRMVLVDDEKGIVEGLKLVIKRYLPECQVVGVAYNGADGYKVIQKLLPDIVITDIRMPQADGLEMIKQVKDKGIQTRFILLSGYADFEYARKGMQLGVQFYINKPVEEEELRDSVRQVMEAIRTDKAKRREVDDLKQEVHTRMQESALRDMLDIGSDSGELMEELLQSASIPAEEAWFVCLLLEFSGAAAAVDAVKESVLQQVYRQIDQVLKPFRGVYRFRYSGAQVAVVVTHARAIGYDDLVRSAQRLREEVHRHLELTVTVGLGTVQKRAAGIGQSFEEARYALSYKFVKGSGAVIPFPDIQHATGQSLRVPEETVAKLEAGIDNMDEAECTDIVRTIFRAMEAGPGMNPADLQLQCVNILLASVRKMSFQQLQQNDFFGRHILSLESIGKFRTLDNLEQWMIQVIRRMIAFKTEHNIPKKKDIIAEVKEYISAHYHETVTLADLAARFFISPYYLSQFFKQKTGETYVNYLTQIRIRKAKELLEKSDLKVYEICTMVGYADPQHFARTFEKLTGSKPSEYRKNLPGA